MANSKMSTKKLIIIIVPIIVVLLAAMIVVTAVMNSYSTLMDNILGRGELIYDSKSEDMDAKYYGDVLESTHYASKSASKAYAAEVNKSIVREGVVLLKNDGALPLAKTAAVTVFGSSQINIAAALSSSGMSVMNKTTSSGSAGLTNNGWDDAAFTSGYFSANSDAAIVMFSRSYGEGSDAPRSTDGRTALSLSSAEVDLLDKVCGRSEFSTVIVLIASANMLESGFLVDGDSYYDLYNTPAAKRDYSKIKGAMLLTKTIGTDGPTAVAELLNGTTSPSGRTIDTIVRDHSKDPTFVNFGHYEYTNGASGDGYKASTDNSSSKYISTFVDYEEGIYVGYKYYETAAYEASKSNYAGFDYDEAVVYPFGHGLSYADFSMEYKDTPTFNSETNEYTFNVLVKNTSANDVKGKHVVQIYCSQPYLTGQVEKSHVMLAGFGKTKALAKGEEDTVTITVNRDYLTSYDYQTEKCYILDAGDYDFYLSDNSHSWAAIDAMTTDKDKYLWTDSSVTSKIVYGENNKRGSDDIAAVNQMDDQTNWKFKDAAQNGTGYATNFQRDNFKGTYPTEPTGSDFTAQDRVLTELKRFEPAKFDTAIDEIAITDSTDTDYVLADMRGLDYDDDRWTEYIRQFSIDSMVYMYCNGNWAEQADVDNGVPATVDLDGPKGLTASTVSGLDAYSYQSNNMIGMTWNTDRAADMGSAIAYEMMSHGFTGWYGPGMNLHRNAFGGRNDEYFGEDAMHSGIMGSAEVAACSEGGVICFNKHFAVNNQETNRLGNISTWVNEQALRETYLRSWEYYVKETTMTVKYYDENGTLVSKEMPGATGVMTSYNLVGAKWAGAHQQMTVTMLREEWGFTGTSLTDAINNNTEYMNATMALYSGASDLMLSQVTITDYDNDYAILRLQSAVKNILYNKANSNCLEIYGLAPGDKFHYGMSPWQVGIMIGWIVSGVLAIAGAAVIVVKIVKGKKEA